MSTTTLSETVTIEHSRLKQVGARLRDISLPVVALGLIVALAIGLRLYNLSAVGDGNLYYTAAVKSMLQSWHNFFFVSAEPGGSVTIDKPPLGLWIQALSALIFGVNGFAVMLPQIVAGVLCVPLLYGLVKRYFGTVAGLIAAFAQAVAPVAIAVERDNTMDATLILILLLAAWAFIKATETARLRWLLLGGFLVGLGFNTKMMQAFLPLPAFYALYFLGAKAGWWRKIVHLGLTTVLLLAVSLSWAVAVDLTPADQRPYIGSSQNNSVLDLMIGYNGLNRLVNNGPGGRGIGPQFASGQAGDRSFTPPAGFDPSNFPQGGIGRYGQLPSGGDGQQGGAFGNEIGTRSVLRLFTLPLANEISWLLPFGLLSIGILLIGSHLVLPLAGQHQAVVLWGGWLLTEVVFFSVAGFFHAYYLAMLAPPLAALVGIGVVSLWRLRGRSRLFSAILIAGGLGTVAFQIWLASQYAISAWWFVPPVILLVAGIGLLVWEMVRPLENRALTGFACTVAALLIIPTLWAGLTTLDNNASTVLPHAYSGSRSEGGAAGFRGRNAGDFGSEVDKNLLEYLEAHTQDVTYLMAVSSSHEGAPYVLETGRPVLYVGGFNGSDPVVDAQGLQRLIDADKLRYILWGGESRDPAGMTNTSISSWLQSSCSVVMDVGENRGILYQCSPSD